jgi:manganese efflux pump family protein
MPGISQAGRYGVPARAERPRLPGLKRRESLEAVLKLLAFVFPLGLDSFAVAAAIGATRVTGARERLRISLIFVIFEAGMPLIGLGLGSALARGIEPVADYLAAAAVMAIGGWMLCRADDEEEQKANRIAGCRGLALIALGISISLDELAIGFTIGLVGLPITAVIAAIAVQALLAAQVGLAIGTGVSDACASAPGRSRGSL